MTPRRGALVGFGQVAERAHLPAFRARQGLELSAVAEESPDRRAAAQAALPGARVYPSLEALLAAEKGLDFAAVATPPFLHAGQALACLRAGLHVLCEKPLTLSLEDLEALRHAAASSDRALFTVHNWAFSPQWLKLQELVADGELGELRHAELHALRTRPAAGALPGDWRTQAGLAGGGVLVDHGWHNLYLLRRVLPEDPRRVAAWWHLPGSGGVEDESTLLLEYREATALLHLSWRAARRSNRALLLGSRSVIELQDDRIVLSPSEGEVRSFEFERPLSEGSAHPEWLAGLLPDFEEAMRDPAARRGNLEEAGFCVRVIHRAYQALRHGRSPLRGLVAGPLARP